MSDKRGPKRTPAQREADDALISDSLKNGVLDYREIAAVISKLRPYKLGWEMVKKDAARIREQWKDSVAWDGDEVLTLARSNYAYVVGQARAAWIRSQENYQHASKKTKSFIPKSNGKNKTPEAIVSEENIQRMGSRTGDPRYLQLIADSTTKLAILYGLISKDAELPGDEENKGPIALTMVIKSDKSQAKLLDFPTKKARARVVEDESEEVIEDLEDVIGEE